MANVIYRRPAGAGLTPEELRNGGIYRVFLLDLLSYLWENVQMATISMFFGILIRMYLGKKDHNPPHIHAIYQNNEAIFNIKTGEKTEGKLPGDKVKLVSAWIVVHRD